MKASQFQLTTSIFLVAVLVSLSKGDAVEECKTILKDLMVEQVESFKTCFLEANDMPKEERAEKSACVVKCTLTKAGILDTDGSIHITGAMKLVEKFPKDTQGKIIDLMMASCQDFVTALDPSDPKCKTYAPIIKCSQKVLPQIC